MFQPEHLSDMFRLEHLCNMFQPERLRDVFQLEHSITGLGRSIVEIVSCSQNTYQVTDYSRWNPLNVPAGTLDAFCTQIQLVWQFDLAFETRIALFCEQLWLLDNLWDVSSLLPIRRAAWARPRLPST